MSADRDAGPPDPAAPAVPRRRRIALLALLALALMLLLTLRWATRPERVADLVLARVGQALGLQITASGVSEYAIGGTPRLVVRDLVARQPGAGTPLLRAGRVYLALPWSTIRSRGAELVVQRVEIDAPVVDLAALQRWLEGRPPGPPPRIPELTGGLRVERGEVIGDGWSFDAIALELPALHPDRAVRARLHGRFRKDGLRIPFDLHVALSRPATGAGLGAFGTATVRSDDWRMPMRLLLSGRLHDAADGIGLDGFRSGALASHVGGGEPLPFVFGLAGPLRYRDGRFAIEPLGMVLRGEGAVPTLDADGALAWQDALSLQLQGRLAGWPGTWPALPDPIGQSGGPLPFELAYSGPADLSGNTALRLRRGTTRFDGRFHLPDMLAWLDQLATGTPLPPLDGRLSTPGLEFAGATFHGVEIEFDAAETGDE